MKAQFEKVAYANNSSWRLLIRRLEAIPFEWHFHPEYELTLTLNSCGERYIGDQITAYGDADLTLLGPNIPHTWQSNRVLDAEHPHTVYVLWFDQQWVNAVCQLFPEYRALQRLTTDASRGLHFPPQLVNELLPQFIALESASSARRLTLLLQILDALSHCGEYELLCSGQEGTMVESDQREQRQLSLLLEQIHEGYTESLLLEDLAQVVAMSESTLTRFFRRMMGMGVNQYITQVRLGKACSLLIRSDWPVSVIAQQSGFVNQANFNRLFKKYKQMTPGGFRRKFRASSYEKRR
ncbi:AraC family transcriptional regulator [Vibrio sp. V39_P1S14PM300]|uniref:AraC family transcriptional regulator n=1 Tax=Vibrio sp. V39_P1S14PM300 TaxID=1938690 RepID=UPI001372B4B1|nr:AraC family transcriptional regulator [Vibrio sp. V39_P1S14PM300]NAX20897.1 helix-turn-helix domain-containing protein [Vibrio sp. V39_P1S14PM300]